jgi:hypothetical protein
LNSSCSAGIGGEKNGKRKEGGSTAVKHSSHHPKVKGLNLLATAGTSREKNGKRNERSLMLIAQWYNTLLIILKSKVQIHLPLMAW